MLIQLCILLSEFKLFHCLGLLFKNEQHNEDMVDILGHFNQYVPTTMDQKGIAEQVLFGGDQLTAERTRSAKALQLNARTEHGQLRGLVPFVEDWHALQCMLQVIIYFHFCMLSDY